MAAVDNTSIDSTLKYSMAREIKAGFWSTSGSRRRRDGVEDSCNIGL